MKFKTLITNKKRNFNHSRLPAIDSYRTKSYKDLISNNINMTTNSSILKNNISESAGHNSLFHNIPKITKKKGKKYTIISHHFGEGCNQISRNIPRKTIDLILNADKIMKRRLQNNSGFFRAGGKFILKSIALKLNKSVSYKNYSIDLLRAKRTEISKKQYFINKALKEYESNFKKDYKNFNELIEFEAEKIREEEKQMDILKKIIDKKEIELEEELAKNKDLNKLVEYNIKKIYTLLNYGSFIHYILGKKFIFSKLPDIESKNFNFSDVTSTLIDLYEKEQLVDIEKNSEDINNIVKQFLNLEEKLIFRINDVENINKYSDYSINRYKNEIKNLDEAKKANEKSLKNLKLKKLHISRTLQSGIDIESAVVLFRTTDPFVNDFTFSMFAAFLNCA